MALLLPVTADCNLRCVFCSAVDRRDRSAPHFLLRRIAQDASGHVQISGGEPLLLPPLELERILSACRRRGKIVELQTNGTLLAAVADKHFQRLLGLVSFFNVNFPAPAAATDEKTCGIKGAFAARLAGVRRLLEHRAQVRLTYVVCRQNLRSLRHFALFVSRELSGVRWLQFSFVKALGRGAGNRRVVPTFQEAAAPLNATLARCRELRLRFEIDHIPQCFVPEYRRWHADRLKMQARLRGPHLLEKRRLPSCRGCAYSPDCPGPRQDYVALYGGL